MAIIKCKMCGGDIELSEDRTYGTCDSCGSIVTLPKIDDEQRAAAFNRGNHFRRMGEFDKALAVYERIVQEDDTDAEAHWCCALCRFGIEYVEDPATREYLPTCHRASFDSFLEDVDYLAALERSDGVTRRQYQKEAEKIAEVQRGILATSQNEKPFDVFICYKESDENGDRTRDSMLAQDIYYQLTEQGLRVFFSRITLEDKAGTQYEPYIFAALNSAKVMIVVGTKPEYMNAVWVKNEWSRFLALMRHDRTKLLIPCYRDMDPYDLPEQLSVLQAYDMSKIGFIQDLIRGVMKVLGKDKKPAPTVETRVVQQTENSANITALLKRGDMALEDGNWNEANGYFDRVLDMDAECAQAYMGKFLAAQHSQSLELFFQKYLNQFSCIEAIEEIFVNVNYDRINAVIAQAVAPENAWSDLSTAFDLTDLKNSLQELFISINRTYLSRFRGCEQLAEQGKALLNSDKLLSRTLQFAKGTYRGELQKAFEQFASDLDSLLAEAWNNEETIIAHARNKYEQDFKDAEQKAIEKRESILERFYMRTFKYMKSSNADRIRLGEKQFNVLAAFHYKDSAEKAKECHQKAKQIEKKNLVKRITFCVICAILVTLLLGLPWK